MLWVKFIACVLFCMICFSAQYAHAMINFPENYGDSILDVPGIVAVSKSVFSDAYATGVTGVFCEDECVAAVVQEGGSPCTSQTDALKLENFGAPKIAGIVLTGGSMYGLLGSTSGVFECLATLKRYSCLTVDGFRLPQISSAAILDLATQNRITTRKSVQQSPAQLLRLYTELGRSVCETAFNESVARSDRELESGAVGAGASAGIWNMNLNIDKLSQGGIGSASMRLRDDITVGAVIAVNVFGVIAEKKKTLEQLNSSSVPMNWVDSVHHTAIGAVATNLKLSKSELHKVTRMAFHGVMDAVFPAATVFDGDTLFGLSTAAVDVAQRPVSLVGAALRKCVALSVYRAVCCAAKHSPSAMFPPALSQRECVEKIGAEFLSSCGRSRQRREEQENSRDEL